LLARDPIYLAWTFGFAKVCNRGLRKNAHCLLVICALDNLFIARCHLLRCQGA
jgi:hypothetical protein